jgi:hypothetical protein
MRHSTRILGLALGLIFAAALALPVLAAGSDTLTAVGSAQNHPHHPPPPPPPWRQPPPESDSTPTPESPATETPSTDAAYPIADTGQTSCYDDSRAIACPDAGAAFSGQDAAYETNQPSYQDNGDGTVSDLVTGLMWSQSMGEKVTWDDAVSGAAGFDLGGYDDWRLPTIKELYSLIDFDGAFHDSAAASTPYIDTAYFDFWYGDESAGERLIDVQVWSATAYGATTMNGDPTVFGVNFADGRIKGYWETSRRGENRLLVRYVRGNIDYGVNDFVDNGDGTVTDAATGLTWQQTDDGQTRDWADSLAYCQGLDLAGRDTWRLPDAKELQSIVDYTRSPSVTGTAAIDPVFGVSDIESYFWTGTTHLDGPIENSAATAVYVAFGRAMGYQQMPPGSGDYRLIDVHGAGAQRSDPKTGDPADYPLGRGPQGDDIRIYNSARCVTGS